LLLEHCGCLETTKNIRKRGLWPSARSSLLDRKRARFIRDFNGGICSRETSQDVLSEYRMSCRAKFVALAGFGILAVIVAALLFQSREPYYEGRSLSNWLEDCSPSVYDSDRTRSEADEAIQAIGSRRAVPMLLPMLQARDGRVRIWALEKQSQWKLSCIHLRDSREIRSLGLMGFRALGTNAADAVPELRHLLQNTNCAYEALCALIYIGKPAADALCTALTNEVVNVRRASAAELGEVLDDFPLFLQQVRIASNDPDNEVRQCAIRSLARQTNRATDCVPLIVAALKDQSDDVSAQAALVLANFGANAAEAADALKRAASSSRQRTPTYALEALVRMTPDDALPILLQQLTASNAIARAQAACVLGQYNKCRVEIISTLQTARTDEDPRVAGNAEAALKHLRDKEKVFGRLRLYLTNDPIVEDERLSYWVTSRDRYGWPTAEAEYVLKSLPPACVPALLDMIAYKDPIFDLHDYELIKQAVDALKRAPMRAAIVLPRLQQLATNEDSEVRSGALSVAAVFRGDGVPVLVRALARTNDTSLNAAIYLNQELQGNFREDSKEVISALCTLVTDADPNVRAVARNALNQIRGNGSVLAQSQAEFGAAN
jgi:HEAT repeat protein